MTAQQLQELLERDIRIVKALACEVIHLNRTQAELVAPLEANSNHLGSAFGGSQYSLAMLCCYSLVVNLLDEENLLSQFEVVVKDSHCQFKRPVFTDYKVECQWPADIDQGDWLRGLKQTQRAHISLRVELTSGAKPASLFDAEFVLLPRQHKNQMNSAPGMRSS